MKDKRGAPYPLCTQKNCLRRSTYYPWRCGKHALRKGRIRLPPWRAARAAADELALARTRLDAPRVPNPLMTACTPDQPLGHGFLPVCAETSTSVEQLLQLLHCGYALQFMGREAWAPPGCALHTLRAAKNSARVGHPWGATMELMLSVAEGFDQG